ncbi:FCS-Like Zinc finger 5-like [Curcuma longa]|uniref:FCS-Like Zinc finger 5-like n=1 Tax=Curcuma longa TaxID=136217 RepID=UPI003D9E51C9
MLLGKRPRPPMEPKTSSMEFPDGGVLFDVETPQPLDQHESIAGQALDPRWVAMEISRRSAAGGGADWCSARGGVQRNPGELSGDHLGTASFLRACGLCRRRLGPGRDAFMYRGEIAFCSLECRQQHMNMDAPSAAQEP